MSYKQNGYLFDDDGALVVSGFTGGGPGAFPANVTVLDNGNRADGTLQAGTGSTKWTANALGTTGNANWQIATNRFWPAGGGAQHTSAFSLGADFDLSVDIVANLPSNYFAIYFSLQNPTVSGWSGYWVFLNVGVELSVKKIINGGSAVTVGEYGPGDTYSPDGQFVNGDKLGIRRLGDAIEIYRYTAGAWLPDPLLSLTDSSVQAAGPICLEAAGTWFIDNVTGGSIS